MKKIILIGLPVLLLAALYFHSILPWTPSVTADYFMSSGYKPEFIPFGIEKKHGGGGSGSGTYGASIDYVYIIDGDSRQIDAAVEKTGGKVRSLLKQDKAEILGSSSGSDMFSFQYLVSGKHGYCTIRAFPSGDATRLIVIFFERK